MKATVIIPCYNCADVVERCIRSVAACTLDGGFEIVAVVDGSSDATTPVLRGIAARDPRLRVIEMPHLGPGAARDAGIRAAKGDWIAFADSDDEVLPGFLSVPVEAGERDRADMVVAPFFSRPHPGAQFDVIPLKASYRLFSARDIRREYVPRVIGYQVSAIRARIFGKDVSSGFREPGEVWRCLYRRSALEKSGVLFDTALSLYEDVLFNAAFALSITRMTCVREPLYKYTPAKSGLVRSRRDSSKAVGDRRRLFFDLLALDRRHGGKLFPLFAGSFVSGAAESFRLALWHPSLKSLWIAFCRLFHPATLRALCMLFSGSAPLPRYASPV